MLLKKIKHFLNKIIYTGFFVIVMLVSYLSSGIAEEQNKSLSGKKIIREIFYDIRDVFSPTVSENSPQSPRWYGDVVNILHNKTKSWVIRDKLLFSRGDSLDIFLLRESERLLRATGLFVDALIIVILLENNSNQVDIQIITQDRWTMILPISYNPEKKSGFASLKEQNIFGFGHQTEARVDFYQDPDVDPSFSFNYHAQNIAGSYVDGSINHISAREALTEELKFERKFFSTATKWVGGFNYLRLEEKDEFFADNVTTIIPLKWREQNYWIGRAFGIRYGNKSFRQKTRFIVSANVSRVKYLDRPLVNIDSLRLYENSDLLLTSVALLNRDYYQDFYVNRFGVTEDIPVGGFVKFFSGFENREFSNRYYFGFSAAYVSRFKKQNYFSFNFGAGGFLNKNIWEQKTYRMNTLFHSLLIKIRDWKVRLLAKNEFLFGTNRLAGERIFLDSENGIRGFENSVLIGTKRVTLNIDANIFSPYKLLGFVLGGNIFSDFGLIGDQNSGFNTGPLYQTYGIGIRLKNESLSPNTIQIALIYSPNNPGEKEGSFGFLFTSKVFELGSLSIARPQILKFGK